MTHTSSIIKFLLSSVILLSITMSANASTTLFVGGLPSHAIESHLQEFISPYGKINNIRLIKDKDTGKLRGFALVEMENANDADAAVAELDGALFLGRNVRVAISANNHNDSRTERTRRRPPITTVPQ